MTTSKVSLRTLFLLTVLVVGAGAVNHQATSITNKKLDCNFNLDPKFVTTLGNTSFVYLGLEKSDKDNVSTILGALCAFEQSHQELQVFSFSISGQQTGGLGSYVGDHVFGLWIYHKPKSKN